MADLTTAEMEEAILQGERQVRAYAKAGLLVQGLKTVERRIKEATTRATQAETLAKQAEQKATEATASAAVLVARATATAATAEAAARGEAETIMTKAKAESVAITTKDAMRHESALRALSALELQQRTVSEAIDDAKAGLQKITSALAQARAERDRLLSV